MKRIFTILKTAALVVLPALFLAACVKEKGPDVAKAVLGDVVVMNFPATAPQAQSVTVVSDGQWHITAPDWITVDPSTGVGETLVTVSVSENADAQGMLEPRTAKLIFSGNSIASQFTINVKQEGDSYRNAQHLTVSQIAAQSDGTAFVLDEATVVALTSAGFVVTDGEVYLYMKGIGDVGIGDKVFVKGIKGSANGIPMVSQMDECTVTDFGPYEYPEPMDLNEQVATYTAETSDYVTVSGVVSGGNLVVVVDEVEYSFKQVDGSSELSLSSYNGHKVVVTGYTYGVLGARMVGILVTSIQDKGLDQLIYFEDDFEWLSPWTESGVTDDVANNSVDTNGAPNVFGNAATYADMITEFQTRGYGYVWGWKDQDWSDGDPDNGNKRTLYLQKNYLKFGKTSYSSGIILPVFTAIEGTDNIHVTFDWCYCMTGGNKPDLTTLTLTLVGSGTFDATGTKVSEEIVSEQVVAGDGTTSLVWQQAVVRINGASSDTRVTIRPTYSDPMVTNPDRKQNRWYLDNIKVIPAEGSGGGGGSSSGVKVFEDDFEWLEEWSAAVNAPDDITNNSVGSPKNMFTVADVAGALAELQNRGYGYIWGWKDQDWSDGTPDNGNKQTLYLMKNYLKFGKSSYNSGIVLPALSTLSGTADVELSFDWCWCMTGASKPDIMTLTVEVKNGGTFADTGTTESAELTSTQPTADEQTKLEWQHPTVTILGATPETRIIIRPTNADPSVSNPARSQNRWYLDNILVMTK